MSFSQISESTQPVPDEKSKRELKNLLSKSKRDNDFDLIKHIIRSVFLVFCSLVVLCIIFCVVYCLIFPQNKFFDKEQQDKLNEFLIEGTIGGAIFSFFKGHIIDGKNKE